MKDIMRVNKTKGHEKVHNSIQLNKPKQLNIKQPQQLTLIHS